MRCTLYVGGFDRDTPEEALRSLFAPYGAVAEIRMIRRSSRDGRAFAYVTFESAESAEAARTLDGSTLGGHRLRVDLAR